jgi:hypothetical protein
VKRESSRKIEQIEDGDIALSISMSPEFRMSSKTTDIDSQYCNVQEEGACVDYLDFNALSLVLKSIMDKLAPHKVWLFIDEYAELHTDMQIALSDMIRRIFCPLKNFVFKIAAIEHRSVFKQQIDSQNYIGLELGADCSTCNLDDLWYLEITMRKLSCSLENLYFAILILCYLQMSNIRIVMSW